MNKVERGEEDKRDEEFWVKCDDQNPGAQGRAFILTGFIQLLQTKLPFIYFLYQKQTNKQNHSLAYEDDFFLWGKGVK